MQARTVLVVGVVGVLAAGFFAGTRPFGNGYIVAVSDSEGLPWDEQRLFSQGSGASRIPMELQAAMRPGDELVFIGNRRTGINEFWDDVDVRRGREVFLPLFRFSSGMTEQRVLSPRGDRWEGLEALPQEVIQARDAGHLAMELALAAVQEVSR